MHATVHIDGIEPFDIEDGVWSDLDAALPEAGADRLIYAAAHVVMLPSYTECVHTPETPGPGEAIASYIDWDATLDVRQHLAGHGVGIAEAMDTAQRFELGWTAAWELIQRTGAAGMDFVAGAGTDHTEISRPNDLVDAVVEQVHRIQDAGGDAVLLPMPLLSTTNAPARTYVDVYANIIDQCDGPLIVHWLGPMFLESMAGYFPGDAFQRVMRHDPDTVRGAKLSLLDADLERTLRTALASDDQLMLTGDDFNFGALMTDSDIVERHVPFGDRQVPLGDFSHALLGVLDGMPHPASIAMRALAADGLDDARHVLTTCESLGRTIFEAPTPLYKCGLAFLAYVNGVQDVFDLPNHMQRSRDHAWYARVLQAASVAGAIADAPAAAKRASATLS